MLNNKGFTFIESLFVVSVIAIISVFVVGVHFKVDNDEYMIEQVKYAIYQAKLNSILYKEKTSLEFDHQGITISSYHYNEDIHLADTSFENQIFHYNKKGHINEGGHIDFKINSNSYRLKFYLGSGSFEIE